MHILTRNVNDAWPLALSLISDHGQWEDSRAGRVLVYPRPVMTSYTHPAERVLFCAARDANPIFHLMESLWMLAGWRNSRWLDLFVSDFSARFGEREGLMWGAYGHRWREWFLQDQLRTITGRLRNDPQDRRCVLSMWDGGRDLTGTGLDRWKDYPCNTHAYFRVREGVLDMTVCCRSNDIVWGCYGANAVHFSVLLEYMAAMVGVPVGMMHQLSNNWHMYQDTTPRGQVETHNPYRDGLVATDSMVSDPSTFDKEVADFVADPRPHDWSNTFLRDTAWHVWRAGQLWRYSCDKGASEKQRRIDLDSALGEAREIRSPDWRLAVVQWLERRRDAREARRGEM